MQLTDNHIQQLYTFTKKHYVEHYDVQTELVDHLANDIEEIITENPALSFEEARAMAFKKFGVFGFMDVVDEKRKQLEKKYFKILLNMIKDWFKLPKIIVTLAIFMVFYTLGTTKLASYIFSVTALSIFGVGLVCLYYTRAKLNKQFKITGKRLMFEDIIKNQGMASCIFIVSYSWWIMTPENIQNYSTIKLVLVSTLITLSVVVAYISFFLIPHKSDELLKKHYPKVMLN